MTTFHGSIACSIRLIVSRLTLIMLRYKENPNIANESVHAQAREALKKYLHYFERVSDDGSYLY